jgi:DNA-directed RNA polymerase subunit M/transcription elongation factor TFIIS
MCIAMTFVSRLDIPMIRFCEVCDNMLYVRTDPKDGAAYVCQMCDNVEPLSRDGRGTIISDNTFDDEYRHRRFLTPLLKYDVTLPRVKTIVCPNAQCSRTSKQDHDVIVAKYDADKLRYIYTCAYCATAWRTNSRTTKK